MKGLSLHVVVALCLGLASKASGGLSFRPIGTVVKSTGRPGVETRDPDGETPAGRQPPARKMDQTSKSASKAKLEVTSIKGGSRLIASSSYMYGNNVTQRSYHLSSDAKKSWIDFESPLPQGTLLRFHLFVHGLPLTGNAPIRLQIWRPIDIKEYKFRLVWEKRVEVELGNPGLLYTINIKGSDSFFTKAEDLLGWTYEQHVAFISFDYAKGHRTFFRDVYGTNDFPVEGQVYSFERLFLPSVHSVAVEVEPDGWKDKQFIFREWSSWSICAGKCLHATQVRTRECSRGQCVGPGREERTCTPSACPHTGWSDWGPWGPCSQSCGKGGRARRRSCLAGLGGCAGRRKQMQTCNVQDCTAAPVSVGWSKWTVCSASCGEGVQERSRPCLGSTCPSSFNKRQMERQKCNLQPCSGGHKQVSMWTEWAQCSVTCGQGIQVRSRRCLLDTCPLLSRTRQRTCYRPPCKQSFFSQWGAWGLCSASCGGGKKLRKRRCLRSLCPALPTTEERACNENSCDAPESMTEWSEWLACSVSCGGGTRRKVRRCIGATCYQLKLPSSETETCNMFPCHKAFADWTNWTKCSVTCGSGLQTRSRRCLSGKCPSLPRTLRRRCYRWPCREMVSAWTSWTQCSASCGGGKQTRVRTCLSRQCPHTPTHVERPCNQQLCSQIAALMIWSDWSACSHPCGGGTRSKTRQCLGTACFNLNLPMLVTESCNVQTCLKGPWDKWQPWGPCSQSCGGGYQRRSRSCLLDSCLGQSRQKRPCNTQICIPEVTWGYWTEWTGCSASCGQGVMTRARCCAGSSCQGPESQGRLCNNRLC